MPDDLTKMIQRQTLYEAFTDTSCQKRWKHYVNHTLILNDLIPFIH